MYILGISAFYHDSSASLLKGDKIIAAAQEERFSRIKGDKSFPKESILFCLSEASIDITEVNYFVFYDKPLIKFERLIETYLSEAPLGFKSFIISIPIWLKDKLYLKETLLREFKEIYEENHSNNNFKYLKKFKKNASSKLMFSEHHQSHAGSAFYPSPFKEAVILTIDGVGEWATTVIAHGENNKIKFLKEIRFPHSLGLLYSAFTYYTGFKVNSGEYKLMGLAPYGRPKYVNLIKENLITIKNDGSFKLDMSYFNYTSGLEMTSKKFNDLFQSPPRPREGKLTQKHMDLAASIQKVTEEIVVKLAIHAKEITGCKNLCLAGGVALNCVANGVLLRKNIFDKIWIQPASGDAGGSLGAAFSFYYQELNSERKLYDEYSDKMQGSFLGPQFSESQIKNYLTSIKANYKIINEEDKLLDIVSSELVDQKIIGWHHGKMEFGPRSLGHRSIIGDPRNKRMQSIMNKKIKFRESFRPFAPSVLREKVHEWYEIDEDSPYMLFVAPVKKEKCFQMTKNQNKLFGINKIKIPRSEIPAVTHVDYSARIQTVHKETNSRYYKLIDKFFQKTGCPSIVNTSFNVRGEPIVCSPEDSFICFMRTEIDVLVIGNFLLYKKDQKEIIDNKMWKKQYELD